MSALLASSDPILTVTPSGLVLIGVVILLLKGKKSDDRRDKGGRAVPVVLDVDDREVVRDVVGETFDRERLRRIRESAPDVTEGRNNR